MILYCDDHGVQFDTDQDTETHRLCHGTDGERLARDWWECLRCGDNFQSDNPGALQLCAPCDALRLKGKPMRLVLIRPGKDDDTLRAAITKATDV